MSANQKRVTKNPCGKQRTIENPYEAYESFDGSWLYLVLKKHSVKENEFTRWYCAVRSPFTFGRFQYGDMYASSVKQGTRKLSINPITGKKLGE